MEWGWTGTKCGEKLGASRGHGFWEPAELRFARRSDGPCAATLGGWLGCMPSVFFFVYVCLLYSFLHKVPNQGMTLAQSHLLVPVSKDCRWLQQGETEDGRRKM